MTFPPFQFIGYDNETAEVAVEDNGPLSFVTTDVDELGVLEKVKSENAQQKYLEQHDELLRDQAEFFYGNLIRAVEPDAEVSYEFAVPPQ